MIRKQRNFDVEAVSDMTSALEELAESHAVSTDYDSVEISPVRGMYGWQAYLQDEVMEAQRREAERRKDDAKPVRGPLVSKAPPSVFYA